jgi:hypothetical protein
MKFEVPTSIVGVSSVSFGFVKLRARGALPDSVRPEPWNPSREEGERVLVAAALRGGAALRVEEPGGWRRPAAQREKKKNAEGCGKGREKREKKREGKKKKGKEKERGNVRLREKKRVGPG